MSSYPAWWDATLTIYNKFENKLTNQITWYRTVLRNCFWKYTGNKVTVNDTVLETNNIIARIPEQETFKEKYLWVDLPADEKEEYFTLGEGDIVIFGEVEDEIDEYQKGHRSSDLLQKYKSLRGCMSIDGIALNVGMMRVDPHYWIKGI